MSGASWTLHVAGSGRGGAGGWAWVLRGPGAERSGAGTEAAAASYRMELRALLEGLGAVADDEPVEVRCGNETLIRALTEWLPGWRARGWRRKDGPVQHADLLRRLDPLLSRVAAFTNGARQPGSAVEAEGDRRAHELAREAAGAAAPAPEVERVGRDEPETAPPPPPRAGGPRVVAYTDGGCRGNPGPGGWGFLLIDLRSGAALERRGGERATTNNRMEITAALEALASLRRPGQTVEIRTDSRYLADMATSWMRRWKARGWSRKEGGEIKNLDLVKRLDELCGRHHVRWTWVRGHAGEPGNEHVDRLTNEAMDAVARGADPAGERRYEVSPVRC